ncbi:MAG: matrixin family metalloprotease [Bryobacteraceae bacterium]
MPHRLSLLPALVPVVFATSLSAEPFLHLKSRRIDTGHKEQALGAAAAPRRLSAARSHIVVQFRTPPDAAMLRQLEARGAQVLDYVPDNAVLVSTDGSFDASDLDPAWMGALEPEDKLSPAIAAGENVTLVAAFFRDVDHAEARTIAAQAAVRILEHPDLLPHQLLVEGTVKQLRRLAEWDELAYLFPASEELRKGRPVRACIGAITTHGTVGQYTAKVGDGWDGPGRNSAEIRYFFQALTKQLPADLVRAEIQRALQEWAKYARLTFTPVNQPNASRSIDILFAARAHGDGFPFDGPGRTLAHTFYPAPPNPEPIAGDMHFDEDETWKVGADVDVFSVALHEAGHALGLGHSDLPGAVMYPYYRKVTQLTEEDIAAILDLYAAREEGDVPDDGPGVPVTLTITSPANNTVTENTAITMTGTVAGGAGVVRIDWENSRGGSGSLPLEGERPLPWSISDIPIPTGENLLTLRAVDATGAAATRTVRIVRQATAAPPPSPVTLRILAPTPASTYRSTSSSIMLSGTAAHPSGITAIEWVNARGGSGTAEAGGSWSIPSISLAPGENPVTVTAVAASGASASRTIRVEYQPLQADTTPPSLTITSPAGTNVMTSAETITLRGTARDDSGIAEVIWVTSSGRSGVFEGTSIWGPGQVPLLRGTNLVTVRARDTAGNISWRSITVTRR